MSRRLSPDLPALEQAVALHHAGRTAEAAEIYEGILAAVPQHFDAMHLLGVIALQEGRLDRALSLISAALRLKPRDAAAINNLGTVHLRKRELERASEQFERAVKLQPNSVGALTNLGTVLRELGRPREALVLLQRAYAGSPTSTTVCNLLGACLLDTGDVRDAVTVFEAATLADPADPDGWSNLAVALNRTGDGTRARACADKAIAMRPDSSVALAALAAVQFEQGQIEAAIATYREAVALPEPSTQTYCGFANALWTSGRCAESFEPLGRAIEMDGNNAVALWKRAMSRCQPFYDSVAEIEASRRAFNEELAELKDWFDAAAHAEAYAAVGTTQPFFLAYQPFNNRDLLTCYGRLCCEWMASMPLGAPDSLRDPGARKKNTQSAARAAGKTPGKIRVGFASAHIRNHSVWNAITQGWIRHLDRTQFEVYLFQLGQTRDELTERARAEVTHFEDGPKTLPGWVRAIRRAGLDALIYPEIGMDALTTQLAALRLAPVQAAAWGHPETTGLPTLDWYLSADALEPDVGDHYSEQLVRLPNLGVCIDPLEPPIVAPDLAALGLPTNEPLLLCPGTPFKYAPGCDVVWARIAKGLYRSRQGWGRIADSFRRTGYGRLVFFRSGNDHLDDLLAQRLRRAFAAENVDFDARVCLIPYLDRPRFFGLMQHATLMLDTLGFSGFNTAVQAIEAGLPVLSHEGAFMRGRLASGIMRRMGLTELVATTQDEFVQTALRLAMDAGRCAELRAEIAQRRGILFHDLEPVRALERWLTSSVK